ncbi:MAG: GH3 auxin-responsive promoter family protein [Bacteroidales bacterium]|nr:GH3 auxin-responsive promoter family protein [Bacteroidales bacterium]
MPLLNSIISWLNVKRIYQIDLFKQYPFNVQQESLFKLIKTSENTEYGLKHDFKKIKTIKDFQKHVPLNDYESVKPYIIRLKQGEQNLLWPTEIKWFAKSSGTTSDKSKFIPVSKEALEDCHFRGGRDVLALYNDMYPNTTIFKGKGLTLGGSHQINKFSNQSYYGDLSAILIENLPFWTNFIKTPKPEIALIEEFEEKIDKIIKQTVNENVTNIAGVPSWTLVLIKSILEHTGKNNLLEIWPNLELFTHGGVSFDPYREQFKKLIPSEQMNYVETYNASEGFFAIQDDPNSSDMLLMLDYGIFYEFIPVENINEKNPKALAIDEVELNENYAIVISTNGGLWRYIIGDTVIFTSKFPYKIKISGRTKHFINAFGEELIIDNAEKALKTACQKTNAEITDYTAGPVFMSKDTSGAHQWLIEFSKPPKNMDYFIDLLDNALKSLNSDYEAKRYQDKVLGHPQIICLKSGIFYNWLKQKGKLGGQNKVPRLANNRKYIEELLLIAEKF